MTDADLDAFTDALQAVAFVCTGRRVHDDLVASYFRLLVDEPIAPLLRALEKFAKSAETGRRFPAPREIREWMTSGATAARGLTDAEAGRVRARVTADMDEWEREGSAGSAWPMFELAWQAACRAEGLRRVATARNRQEAWGRWLAHGAVTSEASPIASRAEVEAIYRAVAPRCSPIFAKALRDIADRIHAARDRDPGEEG